MDPEAQLSFKIYLDLGNDSKPEVRRFGIPQFNVTNYLLLKDKIRMMFPPLRNSTSNFRVSWKDEDGDLVDITSDEELLIALTEMSGQELRKLYVSIIPNSVDDNQVPRGPTSATNGANHAGVVCDNCAGPVHGYRYKCIQCADFDLCANCEMRGAHADHFVIRLSNPTTLRSHFSRGLARLAKISKKQERREGRASRHCRSEEDGHRERRTGEACPANAWFSNFLSQLSDMGVTGTEPQEEPQQQQQQFQQQQQQQQQQPQQQQRQNSRQYQEFPNCTAISELVNGIVDSCLTNVGPIVEKIVDPRMFNGQLPRDRVPPPQPFQTSDKASGQKGNEKSSQFMEPTIDIEVRFEDDVASFSTDSFKTCEKTKPTPSESSNQIIQSETSASSDTEMRAANEGKSQEEAVQPAPTPVTSSALPRDLSMDVDGWTVLTSNAAENFASGGQAAGDEASKNVASQSTPEAKQPSVVPVSAPVENLYPSLSSEMRSKNPKVNESLEKMVSMGFSNTSGWLLNLLEQCNGDIEMVCQKLEPVPPQNN